MWAQTPLRSTPVERLDNFTTMQGLIFFSAGNFMAGSRRAPGSSIAAASVLLVALTADAHPSGRSAWRDMLFLRPAPALVLRGGTGVDREAFGFYKLLGVERDATGQVRTRGQHCFAVPALPYTSRWVCVVLRRRSGRRTGGSRLHHTLIATQPMLCKLRQSSKRFRCKCACGHAAFCVDVVGRVGCWDIVCALH